MKKYIFSHPWLFILSVSAGVMVQVLNIYLSVLSGNIVNAITAGDRELFISYIGTAVAIVVGFWLTVTISTRIFFIYGPKFSRTISKKFFDSIMSKKISDFNQGNSAKYISILNADIKTIAHDYFGKIPEITKDLLGLVITAAIMGVISPINAIIAFSMAPLPLLMPLVFSKKLSKTRLNESNKSITYNQRVKDYLTGFETIKTFGAENNIKPRFYSNLTHLMKAKFGSGVAKSDASAYGTSITIAITFFNLFVAGYLVIQGNITIGELVTITGLSTSVTAMNIISIHLGAMKSTKDIARRVMDIMNEKDEKVREVKITTLKSDIVLKNLSFSYENNEPEQIPEKPMALKNINYTFKKGGKYAIVGPSGSGKSTLAKLLMGYYDSYSGDLLINGSNMRDIDREGLYGTISPLQQNVFVLDDTLENNITLYSDYSDEQYREALSRASLLDLEARLPNGSNTVLGEGGNTISGGERQRISIARSILKGCGVMVMDEATASLDNATARDIESFIVGMGGLTCIFVTHKYSADILRQCDGILAIKGGEMIESGTFDEMYDAKEYFYSLYNVL